MAILQKIRDKTIVTLLVIGLGMVGFLFFGSDSDIVGMISCHANVDSFAPCN